MGSVPSDQDILLESAALFCRDQLCIFFSLLACMVCFAPSAAAERLWRFILDDYGAMRHVGELCGLALCLEGALKLEWRPRNG
ncbi:hypothetical protein ASE08_00865 [Rhizobacter sp. Root16D2]|nr:hypothetical protein ASE08_00865 [Rhizobacter sp. Root16D2]